MENPIENNPQKIELSSEEKEIAKSLENFSALEVRDRIFLLLIWRGLKTASPVSLEASEPESTILDLKVKVEKADLLFNNTGITTTYKKYGLREGRICVVANNKKDLDLMSDLWFGDHDNDQRVYKEIGRMSGYPQTSIDLFGSFTNPNISDEQKDEAQKWILTDEKKKALIASSKFPKSLYPFSRFFYMSTRNWKTELETIRKWVEEIKLVAPDLFKKFITEYEKRDTTIF